MNKISYRTGRAGDLNQVKGLTQRAYGQFRNVLSIDNVKAWEDSLGKDETYLDLFKIATCFVALSDENVIGTAFFIPHGNPFKWFDTEWSYIRLVGVLPEFEGQGIGRQLTLMCIDYAKECGEKTIALHTSEFQHAARHIYESLGFKKQKEIELFEKKYWIYTLELN